MYTFLGFKVKTFKDVGVDTMGKDVWEYDVTTPTGAQFRGKDLRTPRFMRKPDLNSDQQLCELLSFLSLRPGDTDDDYFNEYTDEQLEWANSFTCEEFQADLTSFMEVKGYA